MGQPGQQRQLGQPGQPRKLGHPGQQGQPGQLRQLGQTAQLLQQLGQPEQLGQLGQKGQMKLRTQSSRIHLHSPPQLRAFFTKLNYNNTHYRTSKAKKQHNHHLNLEVNILFEFCYNALIFKILCVINSLKLIVHLITL